MTGYLYREKAWPEGQYAPYQVRIDSLLPGARQSAEVLGKLIWLPHDTNEAIRDACAQRKERLNALVGLRDAGVLDDAMFESKRRSIIQLV